MSATKKIGRLSGSIKSKKRSRRRVVSGSSAAVSKRHPLYGFMKGTVTIAPGVDLTEPADPYWGLDLDAFKETLSDKVSPRAIAPPLSALWWAKKGDRDKAHTLVMDEAGAEAAWVHAYLHRMEGDVGNAAYWYAKARRQPATGSLDAEWDVMVAALLDRYSRY